MPAGAGVHEDVAVDVGRPAGLRRAADLAARVTIALLVLALLVHTGRSVVSSTHHGVQLVEGSWPRDYRATASLDSLRVRLAAQIPAGSRVYIAGQPDDAWWQQRIVELLVIDGLLPVNVAADAGYQIFVTPAAVPGNPPELVVERLS